MNESYPWVWRRTWLIGLIAALVLPGLGWVPSSTLLTRANQIQATEGPDIAAMVLTPQDLAGVGLDGYGLYRALFLASEDLATQIAEAGDLRAESVQTVLTTARFQEAYISTLARPSVTGDASSPWSHAVSVTLQRFADEAGATLAFDLLRRPKSDTATQATMATPTPSDVRWTRSETTGSNGSPAVELHLDIRFGSLVAGLTILDETGGEPSGTTAESLAGRLIDRLEAGASQDEAPLSRQAVTMPGQGISLGGQFYRWLDNEAMIEYAVDPSIAESEAEFMARIGAQASFYVWQRMATGMPGPFDDTFFYSTVTRFSDPEAAAASLDNLLDQVRREGYQEVTEVTETLGLGDQEVVYTANITWESGGTTYTFWYHVYTIRAGRITGNVMMIAPEPPSPGIVTMLAQAQALCLEEGRCAARLPTIQELGGNEGLDFNPSEVHATPTTS
jgi:hypothetical protein